MTAALGPVAVSGEEAASSGSLASEAIEFELDDEDTDGSRSVDGSIASEVASSFGDSCS